MDSRLYVVFLRSEADIYTATPLTYLVCRVHIWVLIYVRRVLNLRKVPGRIIVCVILVCWALVLENDFLYLSR